MKSLPIILLFLAAPVFAGEPTTIELDQSWYEGWSKAFGTMSRLHRDMKSKLDPQGRPQPMDLEAFADLRKRFAVLRRELAELEVSLTRLRGQFAAARNRHQLGEARTRASSASTPDFGGVEVEFKRYLDGSFDQGDTRQTIEEDDFWPDGWKEELGGPVPTQRKKTTRRTGSRNLRRPAGKNSGGNPDDWKDR